MYQWILLQYFYRFLYLVVHHTCRGTFDNIGVTHQLADDKLIAPVLIEFAFKGGPSDLESKILQKYKKNHLYTPKAF